MRKLVEFLALFLGTFTLVAAVTPAQGSDAAAVRPPIVTGYQAANYRLSPCAYGEQQPCASDDKVLVFYYDPALGTEMRTLTNESRLWTYEAVPNWRTIRTENHDNSDLHFFPEDLPGSQVGRFTCSVVQSQRCSHGHIRFDEARLLSNHTAASRRGVACHEIGHGVALTHPVPNDPSIYHCMVTRVNPFPSGLGGLNGHNAPHLNQAPWYN